MSQRQLLPAVFAKQPVSHMTQPRLRHFSPALQILSSSHTFFSVQGFLIKETKQITSDLLLQLTSFSHPSHPQQQVGFVSL